MLFCWRGWEGFTRARVIAIHVIGTSCICLHICALSFAIAIIYISSLACHCSCTHMLSRGPGAGVAMRYQVGTRGVRSPAIPGGTRCLLPPLMAPVDMWCCFPLCSTVVNKGRVPRGTQGGPSTLDGPGEHRGPSRPYVTRGYRGGYREVFSPPLRGNRGGYRAISPPISPGK
jgi:hypothetical protein